VCVRLALARRAMRSPLWKISTPHAVSRASTSRGRSVRGGVIVGVDIDVIVDADPAQRPPAISVRLARHRLERRAVDLLKRHRHVNEFGVG
jgi:hypothetical protein